MLLLLRWDLPQGLHGSQRERVHSLAPSQEAVPKQEREPRQRPLLARGLQPASSCSLGRGRDVRLFVYMYSFA